MTRDLLVVEDSATQRAALAADLEEAGFTVSLARDGQEALELLERGAAVDLIISDVVMPRLGGLELCRRIKSDATLPDLPIVLLTSLQDPLDIVRGLEAGADNFLTKPYESSHLVARVEAILAARAEKAPEGDEVELRLLGERFVVTAERQQILELLVGAFEDLVHANQQLREREDQLATAQADLAAQLSRAEQERTRLVAVLDAIPDGVVIVGADGRITDANPAAIELGIGPSRDAITGIYVRELPVTALDEQGKEIPPASWPLVQAFKEGRRTTDGTELVLWTASGDRVPVTVTAAPIPSGDASPSGAVAVVRDVSAWAFHDRLTALPNRALFADRIARALVRADEEDTEVAVLKLSLDRFTVVHDSLGRGAEDTLVLAVARRLVGVVRADATVARLGGDQFGILLEGISGLAHALRVADRVAGVLERPVTLGHEEVFLTASIGITMAAGSDGVDAETLLRQATAAMHRAVDDGGDRQEVYDQGLEEEARRRLSLDSAMRRGLAEGEFVVHFQPVADLDSGGTVECEALVRWQDPEHGMISPGEFIPLAEESGLIVPLGRTVLQQACEQTQRWRENLAPDLRVSVNLSARQFEDPDLEADVRAALESSGLPFAALTLEVTESALIREPVKAAATLEALRSIGVRIAIDDFGTGYSSLSYLRSFPLDVLKIDQCFVQELGEAPDAAAIVQAVMALAKALGLEVIAEGVETPDQLEWLRTAGCPFAAGYFLARPLPPEEVTALLDRSLLPAPAAGPRN